MQVRTRIARDGIEPDDTHPAGPGGALPAPLEEPHPDAPVPPPPPGAASRTLAALPYAVGVLALAGYLVFVVVLFRGSATATEGVWLRGLHLFGGVEAIAFAAAGFFFGREVNRARAEQAEVRAQTESRRAEDQRVRAQGAERNGRMLTREIRDLADVEAHLGPGAAADAVPGQRLAGLAARAERLFPPV